MGAFTPDDYEKNSNVPSTSRTPEAITSMELESEEDAATVVNIEDDQLDHWDELIRNELKNTPSSEEEPVITIPRVPQRLRYNYNEAYNPRIIAIGPYHLDEHNLKPMEKHKWQYLKAILLRNTEVCLKDYIREIKALEVRARHCYPEEIYLESEMFVRMMLLDSCFVIEYLLQKTTGEDNDLGGMIWMEGLLLHDLLLLENQLPFFVLRRVFCLATKTIPSSLRKVVINFFNKMFSTEKTGLPPEPIHHLLHFYHWFLLSMPISYQPSAPSLSPFERFKLNCMEYLGRFRGRLSSKQKHSAATKKEKTSKQKHSTATKKEKPVCLIPNATVLREAGIKFKKREANESNILDVKFDRGVMEIPPLLIDASSEPQFRNLIAFEQLYPFSEAKFTTYIKFLDNIVNTSEDVALLHRNGIMNHMLGSNEAVARLFNELTLVTFIHPTNYLSDLYKGVDKYLKAKRHWWWASFVHNYLNTPLKILSMVAAIIFLVLTFLQTFFSVYAYFHPPASPNQS